MRRKLLMAWLGVGALAGFAWGFHSVRHHHDHWRHHWCAQEGGETNEHQSRVESEQHSDDNPTD